MNEKKYVKIVVSIIAGILMLCIAIVVIIDPYFHYHAPIGGAYIMDNERYQNYGIIRHFEYDAIITGTSMTENFKASEFDELFNVKSIKVACEGGDFPEIDRLINFALEKNKNVKYIVRGLDYSMIEEDKNIKRLEDAEYPTYLYNENPFDDINYVLSKTALLRCGEFILNTISGGTATTFDEYKNWSSLFPYGKEAVMYYHNRGEKTTKIKKMEDEDRNRIVDNIEENVIKTIKQNPEVTFYLFFPPYSIAYWDDCNQRGLVPYKIEMEKIVVEMLLEYENVRLFSFTNNYEIICNLDNYKDTAHYGEWINSDILKWMAEGKYELTKDNYEAYLEEIEQFYLRYDYDSLFAE